ncbi:MAG: SEC-C metal-binding domain-containing protein [Deltaproteobacteria bacterium]|jgi:tetratricopeptide (TPR) repeat protein|nr:SEC-C metal-binding domain-containing protein [Deltaproteobacteria bacterium]
MGKIGRNTPCPCGSGKKYKKCCLLLQNGAIQPKPQPTKFIPVYTELDQLSNSVMDLIKKDKLDEAEFVSKRLLSEYPDQIDGFERLGQVYEARGKKQIASDYYQKAADFAKTMPGFEQESVEYYLSKAKKMREEKK